MDSAKTVAEVTINSDSAMGRGVPLSQRFVVRTKMKKLWGGEGGVA